MEFYSKAEKTILSKLSFDSRATITELTKSTGLSRVTISKLLDKLEKKLGIKYTLEIDETKLAGSERHLIVIKFSNKPQEGFLREFFKNDEYAQEVYMLEGDFDLFIYARTGDPVNYIKWETYIASELAEYRPVLSPSEFVVAHFGYWPLDNRWIDDIKESTKLDKTDKKMLALLNRNSRISIQDMSEQIKIEKGTVRYRLLRLRKSGILKRFTIAVQNAPQPYQVIHFSNYKFNNNINERMLELRKRYLNADDKELPLLSTWQIVAPISGSFRSFGLSLYDNKDDVASSIDMHKSIFRKDNIEIKHAKITKVIKGLLPFRNLEIKANYVPITWNRNKE
jgi:DNA-binding Lrp family transcriptional regulator